MNTMASNLIVNVIGCNDQVYYYCSTTDNIAIYYNYRKILSLSYVSLHTSCKQSKQPVATAIKVNVTNLAYGFYRIPCVQL